MDVSIWERNYWRERWEAVVRGITLDSGILTRKPGATSGVPSVGLISSEREGEGGGEEALRIVAQ